MTDTTDLGQDIEANDEAPAAKPRAARAAPAEQGTVASLKSQATDKARDLATQGKDRATEALGDASRFLEDTARTVDEKLGAQYGGYARTAAESVQNFATTLQTKDVDELVADARDLVRKSPAIAIGAAAAVGFLFARLLKSGVAYESPSDNGGPA